MKQVKEHVASWARIALFGGVGLMLSCGWYLSQRDRNDVNALTWHSSFSAEMMRGCMVDIGYVRPWRLDRPIISPSSGGVFHFVCVQQDAQPPQKYLAIGGYSCYVKTVVEARSEQEWATADGAGHARRLWLVDDERRVVFALDAHTGEYWSVSVPSGSLANPRTDYDPTWSIEQQIAKWPYDFSVAETDQGQTVAMPSWARADGGVLISVLPEWENADATADGER